MEKRGVDASGSEAVSRPEASLSKAHTDPPRRLAHLEFLLLELGYGWRVAGSFTAFALLVTLLVTIA